MNLHRLRHYAMASTYEIVVPAGGDEQRLANSVATTAFAELDRLEDELSRFRPGSDIWRISQTRAGDTVHVGLACFDCLSLAKELDQATGGAFDITIGPLMNLWRSTDGRLVQVNPAEIEEARSRVGTRHFKLDPEGLRVTPLKDRLALDLGALGKGYALDQLADLLVEWGLTNFLLNAGQSTVYGCGPGPEPDKTTEGWPVTVGRRLLRLRERALSGSGFQIQGAHIIDPRTGEPLPVKAGRSYALAPTAAVADALSTAFMLMEPGQIDQLCAGLPDLECLTDEPDEVSNEPHARP